MAKDRLTKPIQTNPKHDTEIEKIQNECDINKCNEFREIWSLRLDYEAKVDLEVDIRNILIFYIKKSLLIFLVIFSFVYQKVISIKSKKLEWKFDMYSQ